MSKEGLSLREFAKLRLNESQNGIDGSISSVSSVSTVLTEKDKTSSKQLKTSSFLNIQSMNDCISDAKKLPSMKMICGELWRTGSLCIMFAPDGCGKTIFAMQIAEAAACGISVSTFFPNECEPMKVLYCDFELSISQHLNRYTTKDTKVTYKFSDNLFRCSINVSELPDTLNNFEEKIIEEIEKTALHIGANIVIIDNLTYLCSDAEKGRLANRLMKQLSILREKLDVSLLVIGHPPKRDATRILTTSDLGGSKHLSNFADDMFALNKLADDDGRRYLKHLKGRVDVKTYTTKNVLQCEIIQRDDGFLMLQFTETADERSLLKIDDENNKELLENAKSFLSEQLKEGAKHGDTIISEGKQVGVSRNKLYEAKKELGVSAKKDGKIWVWYFKENSKSSESETLNNKTDETVETLDFGNETLNGSLSVYEWEKGNEHYPNI